MSAVETIRNNKFFLFVLSAFLLFFTFSTPPFQKADEVNHFNNTLSVFKVVFSNSSSVGIRKDYVGLPDNYFAGPIMFSYNTKFPWKLLLTNYLKDDKELIQFRSPVGIANFFGYVPAALGVVFSGLFNHSISVVYLPRLFSGLFFLLCVFFSLKLSTGFVRKIIYIYSLVPMVLYQATSIGYDSPILGLSLLVSVLFVRLLSKRENKFDYILFLFFSLLLQFCKPGYYLFILLPLVFILKSKKHFIYTVIFFIIVFLTSFLNTFKYVSTLKSGNINSSEQLTLVKSDPGNFVRAIFNSMQPENVEGYIKTMIGYFGWLDFGMYFHVYLLLFALFSIGLVQTFKIYKPLLDSKRLLLLVSFLMMSCSIIFLSWYFVWTPLGKNRIDGFQGRYFLPYVPIFLFLFLEVVSRIGRYRYFIACLLFIFIFFDLIKSFYNRYYDYSSIFAVEGVDLNYYLSKARFTESVNLNARYDFNIMPTHAKFSEFDIVVSNKENVKNPDVLKYKIYGTDCKDNLIEKNMLSSGFINILETYQKGPALVRVPTGIVKVNKGRNMCFSFDNFFEDRQDIILLSLDGVSVFPRYISE